MEEEDVDAVLLALGLVVVQGEEVIAAVMGGVSEGDLPCSVVVTGMGMKEAGGWEVSRNLRFVQHTASGNCQGRQAYAADDGSGSTCRVSNDQRAAYDAQGAEDHEVRPAEPGHGLEAVLEGHVGRGDGECAVDG